MFPIQHRALLDSTNHEARRLAEAGRAHGTVVWADEQTAGHGRYGRPWHSPPGNLLFSVVLRPVLPAARAAELGFVGAVVTADCVAELLPATAAVGLKWPNDALVGGAKIAGILPEARNVADALDWVVLGVGLNLAHCPEGLAYPVTSLSAHGVSVSPEQALHAFLRHLERWLLRWEHEGFAAVRAAWFGYARGQGTEVTVNLGGRQERGVFEDLDNDGAMILRTAEGRRRITAGDVAFGGG